MKDKLQSAKVVKTHIDKLKMAAYNPRKDLKPSDKEYQKIKASIEEFGYVLFIVVNKDLTVIGGHQRLKVMKELGYSDIEVTQVDLDKVREKALNLALNKIDGIWDMNMLGDILTDISNSDFDINITGFDEIEVASVFAGDFSVGDNTNNENNDNINSDDSARESVDIKSTFEIVVTCEDETEQEEKFTTLMEMGYNCRVLTL